MIPFLFLAVEGELRVRQGGDAALRGGHPHEALQEEDARHHRNGRSGEVSGWTILLSSVVCDKEHPGFKVHGFVKRYEQEIDRSSIVVICQPTPLPKLGRSCLRL